MAEEAVEGAPVGSAAAECQEHRRDGAARGAAHLPYHQGPPPVETAGLADGGAVGGEPPPQFD
jgi:hypothetical protein